MTKAERPLTGDEAVQVQIAATVGLDNPVDTDEGRILYEAIKAETKADPNTNWDVPKH